MRSIALTVLMAVLAIQLACAEKETAAPAPVEPIPAHVSEVRHESQPGTIAAPGTVQPRNRISLSSQINGFVREMLVRVGDRVKQDQVLATLDARDAESQKAAAEASIGEAEAALSEARKAYQSAVEMRTAAKASEEFAGLTLKRYQKLYDARSVSPQEIDEVRMRHTASVAELASRESMVAAAQERIKQVEARLSQAKAQAGRADVMMSWTRIKAPAQGIVVERPADAGTAIFPGTPLLVIESTARPQVLASIPTEHASLLRSGLTVRLRSGQQSGTTEGKIAEVVPVSDASTVQFKVDLPPDFHAPHGQFVKVELPTAERDVLLIPRKAVRETGQLTGVFVVGSDSKARFRLVKTAPFDSERVEVLSGLDSGEHIVSALSDQITDGIPIQAQ